DAERDEVAEGVHPGDARSSSGALHRRCDQSDVIPVPELSRGAPGQTTSLVRAEPFHPSPNPSGEAERSNDMALFKCSATAEARSVVACWCCAGKVRTVLARGAHRWQVPRKRFVEKRRSGGLVRPSP